MPSNLKSADPKNISGQKETIELKNNSFILPVIHLNHAKTPLLRQQLLSKINQAPHFFKNAPVVINLSGFTKNEADWKEIEHIISSVGLRIVGLTGCTGEALKDLMMRAGLPILSEGKEQRNASGFDPASIPNTLSPPIQNSTAAKKVPENSEKKTRVVTTTVRSGQRIYARNSDLVVVSNVNSGAELIADGNIHIYGTMRGRVLAGASGDTSCQIFCTHLSAELVSIAGEYWLMEQIPDAFCKKASHLFLKDGTLAIQALG